MKKTGKKAKKVSHAFTIDCTHPVEDGIMQIGKFEEFLKGAVKVEGKTGNLGKNVSTQIFLAFFGKFFQKYFWDFWTKKISGRHLIHQDQNPSQRWYWLLQEILEISFQEILEGKQPPWLAPSCCWLKGFLSTQILQHQPRWRRRRRISCLKIIKAPLCAIIKMRL